MTTDTAVTAQTPAADAAPAKAADTATAATTAAAPEADKAADQLLFTEPKAEADKAEETKTEEKKDGDAADDKKADEPVLLTAADIDLPEDYMLPDDVKSKLEDVFKANGLTGDGPKKMVQDLVNMHIERHKAQVAEFENMKMSWRKEVETDPTIGGAKLQESVKAANDIVRKFAGDPQFGGSPELLNDLQNDLIMLGLGNKKSLIKFLMNVNAATADGSLAGNSGTGGGDKKSMGEVMWPGMAK